MHISEVFGRLDLTCNSCAQPYTDECERCAEQVRSLPHPYTMTSSERVRIVKMLFGLSGFGVDRLLCDEKIQWIAGINPVQAVLMSKDEIIEAAQRNRRPDGVR